LLPQAPFAGTCPEAADIEFPSAETAAEDEWH